MISALTPEQDAGLSAYVDKWIEIGLCTDPADRDTAEYGIMLAYQRASLPPPLSIVWCDSPMDMFSKMSELGCGTDSRWGFFRTAVGDAISRSNFIGDSRYSARASVHSLVHAAVDTPLWLTIWERLRLPIQEAVWSGVGDVLDRSLRQITLATRPLSPRNRLSSPHRIELAYGQHDASWLGFYEFFHMEMNLDSKTRKADGLWMVARNAGWWLPFKDVCFVTERHHQLERDSNGRLHSEEGMAVQYPDGWGIYAIHGEPVPERVVTQVITPNVIMSEWNAEVARLMIDRYGVDKFILDGGFKKVQSDIYGDLYRIEFKTQDEPIVAILVHDSSTDRDYFLYVPPHIRSAHEGVAWTFGYNKLDDYNPLLET